MMGQRGEPSRAGVTGSRLGRRAFLAGAAALTLAACTPDRPTADGGFVGGDGTITVVAPDQRAAAPHITGTLLDGSPYDSASLAGMIVVYNVWGSWCEPCRKEAPALVAAAKATEGVAVFVGINIRDPNPAQSSAFVRTFEVPYANLYDPDGRALLAFGSHLPPSAIPSTLLVDRQGRVAARVLGEVTEATLRGLVEDLAKE